MNYFKAFKYQLYVNDPHIISSTWSLFNWLPSISTLASNRCFKISVFKIFCNPSCVLCLVAQLCLTLCNPVAYSPPGSSIRGILQARILEWVAMPSSRDLPSPGIKPRSLALQVDSLPSEPPGKPRLNVMAMVLLTFFAFIQSYIILFCKCHLGLWRGSLYLVAQLAGDLFLYILSDKGSSPSNFYIILSFLVMKGQCYIASVCYVAAQLLGSHESWTTFYSTWIFLYKLNLVCLLMCYC